MQAEDSRIIPQIKGRNRNSASDLTDFVEVSSDCNSCRAKGRPLLSCVCVCLCAANCGQEQNRRGLALINSEASEAPNLSHWWPLTALLHVRTRPKSAEFMKTCCRKYKKIYRKLTLTVEFCDSNIFLGFLQRKILLPL